MIELLIVVIFLLILVSVIAIYGYFQGGVEGMLKKEREFNTIEADEKVEVTVFIDFFKQIKRVDSVYLNTQTKLLQVKKNNHLSDSFHWRDMKSVRFTINEQEIFESADVDRFEALKSWLEAQDIDDHELVLEIHTKSDPFIIAFESPERCMNTIKTLAQWENQIID